MAEIQLSKVRRVHCLYPSQLERPGPASNKGFCLIHGVFIAAVDGPASSGVVVPAEADSYGASPGQLARPQTGLTGATAEVPINPVAAVSGQTPVHEGCCAALDHGDDGDSSSTCSECSGSQHHTPSCDGRDEAIAAWLAGHGQVCLLIFPPAAAYRCLQHSVQAMGMCLSSKHKK